MGNNTSPPPSEAAPAYDELFRNRIPLSGYTAVPQRDDDEDVENLAADGHLHHQHIDPLASSSLPGNNNNDNNGNDPLATSPTIVDSNITNLNGPHTHCDVCERRIDRQERHKKDIHCCTMVSVTFMVAFGCILALGVVIVVKTHGH